MRMIAANSLASAPFRVHLLPMKLQPPLPFSYDDLCLSPNCEAAADRTDAKAAPTPALTLTALLGLYCIYIVHHICLDLRGFMGLLRGL